MIDDKNVERVTRIRLENIDYHITDVCNQNCISCGHFCPLVPKGTGHKTKEQISKDLLLLSGHQDITRMITLTGGECTLSPNLEYAIEIARELFPNKEIALYTNGTRIKELTKIKEVIEKNKIKIQFSWYPNVGELILNVPSMFNTDVEIREEIVTFNKTFLCGDVCLPSTFDCTHCGARGLCVQLVDGKLYPCQYAAYFKYFDEYFKGQHVLKLNGDEYVDLNTDITDKEIIDFCYYKVFDLCRHCLDGKRCVHMYENDIPWRKSEYKIDEWYIDKEI